MTLLPILFYMQTRIFWYNKNTNNYIHDNISNSSQRQKNLTNRHKCNRKKQDSKQRIKTKTNGQGTLWQRRCMWGPGARQDKGTHCKQRRYIAANPQELQVPMIPSITQSSDNSSYFPLKPWLWLRVLQHSRRTELVRVNATDIAQKNLTYRSTGN